MAGTSLVRNTRAVAAALACASRANSSRPGQRTSCPTSSNSTRLTNNFSPMQERNPILDLFDVIVESSRVGVRKPEPTFYEMACEMLAIEPTEAVMLDDLGVNLKPARAMGMRTIKVVDAAQALGELEAVIGFELTDRAARR